MSGAQIEECGGTINRLCFLKHEVRVYLNNSDQPVHGFFVAVGDVYCDAMVAGLLFAKSHNSIVVIRSELPFAPQASDKAEIKYFWIDT